MPGVAMLIIANGGDNVAFTGCSYFMGERPWPLFTKGFYAAGKKRLYLFLKIETYCLRFQYKSLDRFPSVICFSGITWYTTKKKFTL